MFATAVGGEESEFEGRPTGEVGGKEGGSPAAEARVVLCTSAASDGVTASVITVEDISISPDGKPSLDGKAPSGGSMVKLALVSVDATNSRVESAVPTVGLGSRRAASASEETQ